MYSCSVAEFRLCPSKASAMSRIVASAFSSVYVATAVVVGVVAFTYKACCRAVVVAADGPSI
jgi:hypothetical protein